MSAFLDTFLSDVVDGLSATPKTLPCKYLYDARGSELFEAICDVEDYYPTRADLEATSLNIEEIAERIGPGARLVELGSGSSTKTRLLLDHFEDVVAYVPIEISRSALDASAAMLREAYPDLEVLPQQADYSRNVPLPEPSRPARRTVVYFPGSTIGNFHRADAVRFLARIGAACGSGGAAIIGVDLKKDKAMLERAYDDSEGVTAAFNLNLLSRINRELGGTFDEARFAHRAIYNEDVGRIEMHLVSQVAQTVEVGGKTFSFDEGESIRTEESYKYSVEEFAQLCKEAGLAVEVVYTDSHGWFSLQLLRPDEGG